MFYTCVWICVPIMRAYWLIVFRAANISLRARLAKYIWALCCNIMIHSIVWIHIWGDGRKLLAWLKDVSLGCRHEFKYSQIMSVIIVPFFSGRPQILLESHLLKVWFWALPSGNGSDFAFDRVALDTMASGQGSCGCASGRIRSPLADSIRTIFR